MKIIYGTSNNAKKAQVEEFIKSRNINVEILSLKDIGFNCEIIEDGITFEENSLIKANAIKDFCNKNNINEIILTDDAGLCVDCLNGEPGVYSARYAGEGASQEQILSKLLDNMKDVEDPNRTAQFVCVLTSILPENSKIITSKGVTYGKIAYKPSVMGKLTYGPVFIPNGFDRTMNELTIEELGSTHREKALVEMLDKIQSFYGFL